MAVATSATAEDMTPYQAEQDPRRLALVIANPDYDKLDDVPSATKDAAEMGAALTSLGFQVTTVKGVGSVTTFEETALPNFRGKLQEGDIVVVYFSGHGFAYGQDNYLAASDMGFTTRDQDLARHAMAVDSVASYLAKRRPGILVFIIDACRSLAGFVITDNSNKANVVTKGFAAPSRAETDANTIVAYGAKLGTSAIGSADAGKMSMFTESLVRYLGKRGVEFGSLFNDVSADVRSDTGEAQQPGIQDWSDSDLYLTPSDEIKLQQREAWNVALSTSTEKAVRRFSNRYSTSRHAAAARKWLVDHPKEALSYTLVSPVAVEYAWQSVGSPAGISRVDMGFGYERAMVSASSFDALNDRVAGLINASNTPKKLDSIEINRLGESLSFHDDIVAWKDLQGKVNATSSTPEARVTIPAGSRLKFVRFAEGRDGALLMEATGADARLVSVNVPRRTLAPLSIGHPLAEMLALPAQNSIVDLLDRSSIDSAVAALQKEGRTPTWVSIAYEPSDDKDVGYAREARASHALYLLKQRGIEGTRITTIGLPGSGLGEAVRVRFFGY